MADKRKVVLLGAGHTNASILRTWRKKPIPGVELTCISDFPLATYSGMLPGVLAGQYSPRRMQIDLIPLCLAAGAKLIVGKVIGIDLNKQQLFLDGHRPLDYDVLSIGIGSVPNVDGMELGKTALLIKPMQTFLSRLDERLDAVAEKSGDEPLRLAIIGGGAAGVEMAFCLPYWVKANRPSRPVEVAVIHGGECLLEGAASRARRLVEHRFRRRGIHAIVSRRVVKVDADTVELDNGDRIAADLAIIATTAKPPPLLRQLALPMDDRGFLTTDETLRVVGCRSVFAVGDTGTIRETPTAKAGVYAVRHAPVLMANIHREITGRPLRKFHPQTSFLKIMNTGDGQAIAEYKGLACAGTWCWRLKDRIDNRFIDKFTIETK